MCGGVAGVVAAITAANNGNSVLLIGKSNILGGLATLRLINLFEVPLRCITRKEYPDMLTAGRSATGIGYGRVLLRVIPPAIITGQAAAHTSHLAIKDKVNVANVNISVLQKRLEYDNIMVHFLDEYVSEDRTVIIRGKN